MLRVVALDLLAPLIAYQLCREAGVPTVWALVAAAVPPAVGVVVDWLRRHTLEVVGVTVLAGLGASVVLALLTDDPHVVLLEGPLLTAAFGVACLVSLGFRRPLILRFAQAFEGGRHTEEGAELESDYDAAPVARRFWRVTTVVWGIAYLVDAAARVVVIQTAPTSTALAVNRVVPWVVFAVLLAGTVTVGNRLRARS